MHIHHRRRRGEGGISSGNVLHARGLPYFTGMGGMTFTTQVTWFHHDYLLEKRQLIRVRI